MIRDLLTGLVMGVIIGAAFFGPAMAPITTPEQVAQVTADEFAAQ